MKTESKKDGRKTTFWPKRDKYQQILAILGIVLCFCNFHNFLLLLIIKELCNIILSCCEHGISPVAFFFNKPSQMWGNLMSWPLRQSLRRRIQRIALFIHHNFNTVPLIYFILALCLPSMVTTIHHPIHFNILALNLFRKWLIEWMGFNIVPKRKFTWRLTRQKFSVLPLIYIMI